MSRTIARSVSGALLLLAATSGRAAPPYLVFYKPASGATVKWAPQLDLQVDAWVSAFKNDLAVTGDADVRVSCPALNANGIPLHPWGGQGNPWHANVAIPAVTTPLAVTCSATISAGSPIRSWSTQASFTIEAQGPADLSVLPSPDTTTSFPSGFRVENVGHSASEATLLRVKVEVLDADTDLERKSCLPKFTDFDDVVPALTPAGSGATSATTIKPPPPDPLKIHFIASARAALPVASGISTQPAAQASSGKPDSKNPGLSALVSCRFSVSAELGPNQNQNDPNKANNKANRILTMKMPPR